jgi:hypothetical protein
MTSDGNVIKTGWYTADAWRVGQEPEAIMEALKVGEQVMGLLIQAATLIEHACQDVYLIIDNAAVRCQVIVDQLIREIVRLAPVLTRLRAASRAVS